MAAAFRRQRFMFATIAAPFTTTRNRSGVTPVTHRWADVHPIRNVLRIDNVETRPAERITANDEERQRQGFDIQTVFTWPQRDGQPDVIEAVASDADGPILTLSYAPGATISRLNKGLRRRKEKSIFGFGIDPATGRWTGSPEEGRRRRHAGRPVRQRVVPIVQDHKNAALVRVLGERLSEHSMATLQHAIARGLEIVFQLEEGEILTEPVPARENRRAILAFEATEGGAGVLGRLTTEPQAARARGASRTRTHALSRYRSGHSRRDPALLVEDDRTPIASRAATAACSPITISRTMSISIARTTMSGLLLRLGQQRGRSGRSGSRGSASTVLG